MIHRLAPFLLGLAALVAWSPQAPAADCALTQIAVGPPAIWKCDDPAATTITVPAGFNSTTNEVEVVGSGASGGADGNDGGAGVWTMSGTPTWTAHFTQGDLGGGVDLTGCTISGAYSGAASINAGGWVNPATGPGACP